MIQDFTHVQYFAICLKDFPWCPSFLPRLPHTLKGFAHCTVLFLLKNPAHKQDKWFKNNSHNWTKINEGRGWMTRGAQGKEVGGLGSRDMHPFIPSCQWKGWWQEQQQQQSWLAFNLCKAPGVWVCHLKVFLFIHKNPKGERKNERNPLPQWGAMNHVKEIKPINCVASPIKLSILPLHIL